MSAGYAVSTANVACRARSVYASCQPAGNTVTSGVASACSPSDPPHCNPNCEGTIAKIAGPLACVTA